MPLVRIFRKAEVAMTGQETAGDFDANQGAPRPQAEYFTDL